ncbi:MAG: dipeptidase [Tepidanaerobacteraceae bacterium]
MFDLTEEQESRAKRIHNKYIVFDAHCDTILSVLAGERKLGDRSEKGHIDIPRLIAGSVNAQVFAVFVRPEWYNNPVFYTLKGISLLKNEIEQNSAKITFARSSEDIEKIARQGKISALLSIEGGEALQGDLDMLRIYNELGVRSITLTWNNRNALADGAMEQNSKGGLSDFGVAVVKEMNRLGMIVDIAHISPQGFWDVIENSTKPPIVSHSLPRRFVDSPRNLDDDQIKAVAQKGGVIGASLYFSSYGDCKGSIQKVLDVIDYFVNIAGPDHVGLGSDFDGFDYNIPGISSCEEVINITRGLVSRGYGDEEIEKILGKNFLRVYSLA